MKKFIPLAVLAVMIMASCSEEEDVIENGNTTAIKFTSVVNNNSTRATPGVIDIDVLKASTDGFAVSTSGLGTGLEMDNVIVKYNNPVWEYTGDYYWPINPTQSVSFVAYAPAGTANVALTSVGLTATNFVPASTIADQVDLLYASPANFTRGTSGAGGVALTFNHVLSQVVFSVTTDISSDDLPTIESIVLTIPSSQGSYNGTSWTTAANQQIFTLFNSTPVTAVAVTSTPLLLVPQSSLAGITAAITFSLNGTASTNTVNVSSATAVTAWESGTKITYNIAINSADFKVKFTEPTVSTWSDTSGDLE